MNKFGDRIIAAQLIVYKLLFWFGLEFNSMINYVWSYHLRDDSSSRVAQTGWIRDATKWDLRSTNCTTNTIVKKYIKHSSSISRVHQISEQKFKLTKKKLKIITFLPINFCFVCDKKIKTNFPSTRLQLPCPISSSIGSLNRPVRMIWLWCLRIIHRILRFRCCLVQWLLCHPKANQPQAFHTDADRLHFHFYNLNFFCHFAHF